MGVFALNHNRPRVRPQWSGHQVSYKVDMFRRPPAERRKSSGANRVRHASTTGPPGADSVGSSVVARSWGPASPTILTRRLARNPGMVPWPRSSHRLGLAEKSRLRASSCRRFAGSGEVSLQAWRRSGIPHTIPRRYLRQNRSTRRTINAWPACARPLVVPRFAAQGWRIRAAKPLPNAWGRWRSAIR
jgi:hypothetical protein